MFVQQHSFRSQSSTLEGLPHRRGHLFIEEKNEFVRASSATVKMVVNEVSTHPRRNFAIVLAAVMYFGSTALTLACGKLVYNSGSAKVRPSMVMMVTTCQAIATILWGTLLIIRRFLRSPHHVANCRGVGQPRFWLLCVPYSVGYFFVYYIMYLAVQHVSGVAFVALMMARVNIDMFLEALFLNRSSETSRVGAANMIMICAIVHMLTVPASDVSSTITLGCVFTLAFNIVSSATYTYIPWLRSRGYEDMLNIAFVTSAQQALVGLAFACVANHGFSGLFNDFVGYQPWVLVCASLLLDGSCFFGLQYLSPLAITLLGGAMQVPVMLLFETLFFAAPLDAAYVASAVAVLASVVSFTIVDREAQELAKESKLQSESQGITKSEHMLALKARSQSCPALSSDGSTVVAIGDPDAIVWTATV